MFSVPGCYEKEISYINGVAGDVIPLSQIDSLKQISEHCLQTFRYECTLAPLRADDVDYAFWTDRTGDKNVYFTGTLDCYTMILYKYSTTNKNYVTDITIS